MFVLAICWGNQWLLLYLVRGWPLASSWFRYISTEPTAFLRPSFLPGSATSCTNVMLLMPKQSAGKRSHLLVWVSAGIGPEAAALCTIYILECAVQIKDFIYLGTAGYSAQVDSSPSLSRGRLQMGPRAVLRKCLGCPCSSALLVASSWLASGSDVYGFHLCPSPEPVPYVLPADATPMLAEMHMPTMQDCITPSNPGQDISDTLLICQGGRTSQRTWFVYCTKCIASSAHRRCCRDALLSGLDLQVGLLDRYLGNPSCKDPTCV